MRQGLHITSFIPFGVEVVRVEMHLSRWSVAALTTIFAAITGFVGSSCVVVLLAAIGGRP